MCMSKMVLNLLSVWGCICIVCFCVAVVSFTVYEYVPTLCNVLHCEIVAVLCTVFAVNNICMSFVWSTILHYCRHVSAVSLCFVIGCCELDKNSGDINRYLILLSIAHEI